MLAFNNSYGRIVVLGGAKDHRFNNIRRRKIINLKRSIAPPGVGFVDLYQFGRGGSKANDFVILCNKFKKGKNTMKSGISRYSFTLIGCTDTGKAFLSRTAKDESGTIIFPRNDIFIMTMEKQHCWIPVEEGAKFELSSKCIISLSGVTLLWNPSCYGIIVPYSSFCKIDPCKHIVPIEVAKFWSQMEIPSLDYEAMCPLCEKRFHNFPGYNFSEGLIQPITFYEHTVYTFSESLT